MKYVEKPPQKLIHIIKRLKNKCINCYISHQKIWGTSNGNYKKKPQPPHH